MNEEFKSWKVQKLIDFKNNLLDSAAKEYDLASAELNKLEEMKLLVSSRVKEKIATEISNLIYE